NDYSSAAKADRSASPERQVTPSGPFGAIRAQSEWVHRAPVLARRRSLEARHDGSRLGRYGGCALLVAASRPPVGGVCALGPIADVRWCAKIAEVRVPTWVIAAPHPQACNIPAA